MEPEKPFACKEEGCKMTFTNEDHLTVHRKKHEMALQLSLNNTVADQTPTPTRLIKNCEEVGLFEDLQHVNPFDETFRRAVESKIIEKPSISLIEDETLHTPHVFPISEHDDVRLHSKKKLKLNTKCSRTKSTDDTKIHTPNLSSIATVPKQPDLVYTKIQPKIEPSFICASKVIPIEVVSSTKFQLKPSKQFILPKVEKTNLPTNIVRERIRAALKRNPLDLQQPNKDGIRDESQQVTSSTNIKNIMSKPEINNDLSKKITSKSERDKAASKRYRNKRKTEYTEIVQKNNQLTMENENLKAEIAQLKTLLLAHENCSVSKVLASGHNIPIGLPKLIVKDAIVTHQQQQQQQQIHSTTNTTQSVYFLINEIDIPCKDG